ncbi:hypothetical protein Cenrod_1716 [Candidatus Symbiobacter mobilis CR]|uniref:GtrA/DPMS transmembrane domain-containing protein n=1 Tax=Candidatus Symbiobacter mobilis CR TaxID=946483 RepID=U5N8B3_9BURK|nr:hypothetical protein Cenrod_1716 [Candidatus Symbiobacter mobilis CR]
MIGWCGRRAPWIQQFVRYGLVGVGALGVDVGAFTLARYGGADLVTANVLGRLLGALAAFAANYAWTFALHAHRAPMLRCGGRYVVLWGAATVLSTLLLHALLALGVQETVGKVLVEAAMPILNFVAARYWVFRQQGMPPEGTAGRIA